MTLNLRRIRIPLEYNQYRKVNMSEVRPADIGAIRRYFTTDNLEVLMDERGILTVDTIEDNSVNEPGVAGELIKRNALVMRSPIDGKWYNQSSASESGRLSDRRGIVNNPTDIPVNGTGLICVQGYVAGYTGLTPGALMYASPIPGGYSDAKPVLVLNGPQQAIAPIGYASEDGKRINVSPRAIVYQKRVSLDNNASTTITHHVDTYAPTREVRGYISTNALVIAQTYALSNVDSEVQIRSPLSGGYAQRFTLTSPMTISRLRVMMRKQGNPTGSITGALYTAVNGLPGALVATATNTISAASLATGMSVVEYTFNNVALSGNTPYMITLTTTDIISLANGVFIGVDTSDPDSAYASAARQTTGLVWATIIPNTAIPFELLSSAGAQLSQGIVVGLGSAGLHWQSGDAFAVDPDTKTTVTNKTGAALPDVVVSVEVR